MCAACRRQTGIRRRAGAAGAAGSLRQHARGLDAQPVLEQRRVDAAEVGRDDEVLVVVEAARGRGTRCGCRRSRGCRRAAAGRPRRGRCRPSRCPRAGGRTRSRSASARARRGRARRGRPARRAASRRGPASRSACAVGLRVVRVEAAAARRRDARAEAGAEQAPEVAERLAEIAVGVGHRRRRRACPPWPAGRGGRASRSCCRTSSARRRGPGAWRGPARGAGRSAGTPSRPRRPGCRSRSREGEDTVATGARLADQRGILAPADVDALQRVVACADLVERAPEPAAAVGRRPDDAAAPVAARVEVRLVGVGVVDGGQHGDLAGVVELAQAGEARMPAEARACRRAAAPSPDRRRCASAARA